jgi:tetratricopeptide (TPR) repeat protein
MEAANIRCWIAPRDVTPSADWGAAVVDAITAAHVMIVIFSSAANNSGQLQSEVSVAVDNDKPILPFRIEDVAPSGSLRLHFGRRHWLDAFTPPIEMHIDHLVEMVSRLLLTETGSDVWPGSKPPSANPYKGLLYFEETDGVRFFGREKLTDELYARLTAHLEPDTDRPRILPVIGPSGCGKSSLVRAGLVPRLARERVGRLVEPRVLVLTPGPHPLEALARALAGLATGHAAPMAETDEFFGILSNANRTDGLRRIVDALPNLGPARLILVVDQFEELYVTQAAPRERESFAAERDRFVAMLMDATADRGGRLTAVTVLRSDFMGATQCHPELNAQIARWGFLVPGMAKEEIEAAICKPAELARPPNRFAKAFVQLLVNDVLGHPGTLPLLQFALQRVWDALPEDPMETLAKLGGVGGAVAAEAENIFGSLSEEDQAVARRAFLAMVNLGEGTPDTRRRAKLDDITTSATDGEREHSTLARFARPEARLITLSQEPGTGVTFEVAHETLIRRWDRLRDWLHESRDDQRLLHRAREAAECWTQNKGSLWRSFELEQLREFAQRVPQDISVGLRPFLDASLAADAASRNAERRRQRNILVATASGLIVALMLAGIAGWQWRIAEMQRSRAERSLVLATDTANGLVFDLAQQFRNVAGVPAATVKDILDRARKLQDQLLGGGETSLDLRRSEAETLIETSNTLLTLGDTQGALATASQARDIFRDLVVSNPDSDDFNRELSVSNERIGDVLVLQGELDAGLAAYRDSLAIRKPLALKHPDNTDSQRDLSVGDNKIGDVLLAKGQLDEALVAYREGLAIRKALALNDPGNAKGQRDLSVSDHKIGHVLVMQGHLDDALTTYRDGLTIRQALARNDHCDTQCQRDVSVSEEQIGDVLVAQGRLYDALPAYIDGLDIAKALAAKDPGNTDWQRDVLVGDDRIGDVLVTQGYLDDALSAYRDGLAIAKALALKDSGNTEWQRDLSVSYDRIGDILVAQGQLDDALAIYRKSLVIKKTLALKDPGNTDWQRDLAVSDDRIGDALLAKGEVDAALAAYRDGLTIRDTQSLREPSNVVWQIDLVVSLCKVASVGGESSVNLGRADAILKRLYGGGVLPPDKRRWMDDVSSALEKVNGE